MKKPNVQKMAAKPNERLYRLLIAQLPTTLTPAEREERMRAIARQCGYPL